MKPKPAPLPPITRAAGPDPRALLDKINELVAEVNRLRIDAGNRAVCDRLDSIPAAPARLRRQARAR